MTTSGLISASEAVRFDESAIERLKKRHGGLGLLGGKAEAKGELARDVGLQADGGADRFAQDGGGILLGDFLDLHAASRAGHDHRSLDGAVHQDAEVELTLNIEAFFDRVGDARCDRRGRFAA